MLDFEGSVRFEIVLGQNTHVLKLVKKKMKNTQKLENEKKNRKRGETYMFGVLLYVDARRIGYLITNLLCGT